MTLEDLRAFVTAYQAENLTEAGRRLGCTQGAVAQHVRKLERELGVELFSRAPRGVVPTELGRVLYEGASSALGNLEMAVEELERRRNRRSGTLRLTLSAVTASDVLKRPILALKKRRPDLEVEIEPENTVEGRLRALREGRTDLAFGPLTCSMRGLEYRVAMHLQLVLLVNAQHPFAQRKRLSPRELGSIRYLSQAERSATRAHLDGWLSAYGVALTPAQIVEDPTTAILMVELGRGETFVTTNQARLVEAAGRARGVPVRGLPPLPIGWIARNFALLPDVAVAFLDTFQGFAPGVERWIGGPSPNA